MPASDDRSPGAGREPASAHWSWRAALSPLLYFALILLSFYRSELFFFLDEYAGLYRRSLSPSLLDFSLQPHNEHFKPLFLAFWAVEVALFRERYAYYVVTNAALLALVGFAWERWLRVAGVRPALAVLTTLSAMTCLAQAENVMWGWQSSILLSTAAMVGVLHAYSRRRLGAAAVLCAIAALTFSSGYILPVALSAFLVYDYVETRERRLLRSALGMLALFAALVALQSLSGAVRSGQLSGSIWTGEDFPSRALQLLRLGWYTLGVAFYGPVHHLLRGVVPDGPSTAGTLIALGLLAAALRLCWRQSARGLIVKLAILQIGLFTLITPFRHTPESVGFSDRYFTFGLIPWMSIAALALSELVRRPAATTWLKRALPVILVLISARNVWLAVTRESWHQVEFGRASRLEYYETKKWLAARAGQPVANVTFSTSVVARSMDLSMIGPAIGVADPSFDAVPTALVPVRYIESVESKRRWGPIVKGRPAIQTIRVSETSIAEKLELLVTRDPEFHGRCELAILDDAGRILWAFDVASELWPASKWIGVPIDRKVVLEPGRTYSIRIASDAGAGPAPTVWMDHEPGSPVPGETRTPSGVTGALCFRLALSKP